MQSNFITHLAKCHTQYPVRAMRFSHASTDQILVNMSKLADQIKNPRRSYAFPAIKFRIDRDYPPMSKMRRSIQGRYDIFKESCSVSCRLYQFAGPQLYKNDEETCKKHDHSNSYKMCKICCSWNTGCHNTILTHTEKNIPVFFMR